ncbi:hypothetical protein M3Y98_01203100 [Aphelenchoides besseyi]|nr:hypothetical protein M3Y98_01203100 [Aphelenchoides besseyi]
MEVKTQIVVVNNTKRSTASRSNIIAGTNVMSQIVFNFLPNLASFLVLQVFEVTLTSIVGPLVASLFQLDALFTTIVYLVIIGGRVINGKAITPTPRSTTLVQRG